MKKFLYTAFLTFLFNVNNAAYVNTSRDHDLSISTYWDKEHSACVINFSDYNLYDEYGEDDRSKLCTNDLGEEVKNKLEKRL